MSFITKKILEKDQSNKEPVEGGSSQNPDYNNEMMTRKLCFLIVILGASAVFAAYPDEYPMYLRLLGLSKDQIRDLHDGDFIVRSLKERRPGEYGITAAKVFDVPGYYIRDHYSYIENFRSLRNFQAIGKFKPTPELQDLAPLKFDDWELQDLAGCRSNCRLNLTDDEIAGIRQNSNLEDLYRKILLNRIGHYLQGGDPSESYLQEFPHLSAYFPDVLEYLAVYPAAKDRRIPDFFYWAKERIGRKNVIQIRHVFSQKVEEDFVMVDHLVYSNHSLLASAFVLHLINYVDGGMPRTLAVYHGRNYVDSEAGRAGGVDKKVFAAFRFAGEELEERYLDKAYSRFPHGLTPTDQR